MGSEWADAVLDISLGHPLWSGTGAWWLLPALEETREPERLLAHFDAAAAVHDAPWIAAASTYLNLEHADRAGDWARARELHDRLDSIRIPSGESSGSAMAWLDSDGYLDPDRPLRTDTKDPRASCRRARVSRPAISP
jgi:hypothetical protein